MGESLQNTTVLVVGRGSGIARGIVEAARAEGASVTAASSPTSTATPSGASWTRR